MNEYVANHVKTLDEALVMIGSGIVNIISRIPLWDLMSRASLVRDGLFDFDGTLHPRGTWVEVGKRLPEELRQRDACIRSWYWKQTHSSTESLDLTNPNWFHDHLDPGNQAVVDGAWVADDIAWYIQAGLTRQDFLAVAEELGERRGARELLLLMRERCICTFGIEAVAEHWLTMRSIRAHPIGTRLFFDGEESDARLIGHHPNVVASPTKKIVARMFLNALGINPRQLLVIGDSVVDVHMMEPETFNVLIVPPSELDKKLRDFRENNLQAMWDRITMILADDSLEPLVELLQDARESV